MFEASIKYQDKYFIAVNTDPIPDNLLESFLKKVKLFSKKCQVHLTRTSDPQKDMNIIKEMTVNYRNFRIHPISNENTYCDNKFSHTINYVAKSFLHSSLPFLLVLEDVAMPPLSLLKKFDRATNYLEKTDSRWGVLSGIYHRGFSKDSNSGNTEVHVLSGCAVYKRKVIEKLEDKIDLPVYNNHAVVYQNEYSYYDGHGLIGQKRNTNKITPVIVKA